MSNKRPIRNGDTVQKLLDNTTGIEKAYPKKQQTTIMNTNEWTTTKPEFKEDCVVVTATLFNGLWDYQVWQVIKTGSDEGLYMAWLTGDGEEYGDLADMSADIYLILPLIN